MTRGPAPSAGRGEGRATEDLFGPLLFLIAALPRLFVALRLAGEPVWDGHYYDFGARRIAEGLGYSDDLTIGGVTVWHPWCHYPVGYSAFVAFFYKVVADDPRVVACVDALTGAALAWVTWHLARTALSEARARIAGLLAALHPGLILYAGLEMSEPLAALLTLVAFWITVRDRHPLRGLVLGALTLGVSSLVRPQALLCAPFLGLFAQPALELVWARTLGRGRWRHRLAAASFTSALALLPVLPWTARNCRVMDGCALVSTNAGWNLAIGASPRATGRFETLRASDGCAEVTGQVEQDRCWLAYGVDQIRAAPRRWLALIPRKLGYTFDHESFAVEYLHEARPELWPDDRRAWFRGVTSTAHRLLVVAAAFGVVAVSQRRGRAATVQGALTVVIFGLIFVACSGNATFWPLVLLISVVPWLRLPGSPPRPLALSLLVAFLGTTVVTHAVFFGEDRYHLVVTPVFCVLAAGALRRASAVAGAGATSSLRRGAS